jgi:uncharacterized protein with GYD domain
MAHYMLQFSYSHDAVKALVAKPQDRKAAAKAAIEGQQGKLLEFYFAFGEFDGVAICEYPDNVTAAAVAMALGASGSLSRVHTTVLLSAKEAEAAMKHAHDSKTGYKPPQG